jgi:hypothetical protein
MSAAPRLRALSNQNNTDNSTSYQLHSSNPLHRIVFAFWVTYISDRRLFNINRKVSVLQPTSAV